MRELKKNIKNLYGVKGQQWLDDLPNLVDKKSTRLGITSMKPCQNLSYNYVVSGLINKQPIILKLSPNINALAQEARALRAFAGFGTIKLLAEESGLLLLERAVPGISLRSYFPNRDDYAMAIELECLNHLHKAKGHHHDTFPHVRDWLKSLDGNLKIPELYLVKARQLRGTLLQSSTNEVLLHGDLHHDNILQNGNDWLVIDPKGVIGEPAYEIAAFIRNPIPGLLGTDAASSIISHRITSFAKALNLPSQRILDWSFVQAVLAWAWALEDDCDVGYFRKLTEFFDKFHYIRDS